MMRIGQGFDVHALVEGRPLVIGGVTIPYERGLLGYSDADVLLHAICDALIGAAALGDIGKHFPDTDAAYKNADSRILLRRVFALIEAKGYELGNCDLTILAEKPKLAPHISLMQQRIAEDLNTSIENISIKATTTEKLGFVGRQEGIEAHAVVCLIPKEDWQD